MHQNAGVRHLSDLTPKWVRGRVQTRGGEPRGNAFAPEEITYE
jgi:hypothetical protein